jgi:hypothetical protein
MAKIVRDDRARQGPMGRPVLMVLIGAFVLIGIYLVSMLVWSGSQSPDSSSQEASREATTGSSSGSSNPTTRVPPANPAYPAPADSSATGSTPSPSR